MTVASPSLNVLVVGAGMYVSGAGTSGYGTVVPTLCEASKHGLVGGASIVATNPANRDAVLAKAATAAQLIGSALRVTYSPERGASDPAAYRGVAERGGFDCAIVSVPDHLHYEVTRFLLERGMHVLVVKPFVPTLAEADELIRLAQQRNLYGAVEFHKRFDEANLRVKRMLREGNIGDVLYAHVEFSQRRTVPLAHFIAWSARSNIFQYLAVHYVDMIHFCTGARPVRALATGQRNLLQSRGVDTWDSIQGVIEWASGSSTFVSTILANWIDAEASSAMSDQRIKWIGTAGRVESDQKDRGLELVNAAGVQHVNPYYADFLYDAGDRLEFGGYGYRSIVQFLRDVASIKSGDVKPSSLAGARATFEQARVSTAVVEAVNRSLRDGGNWVEVSR